LALFIAPELRVDAFWPELSDAVQHIIALDTVQQPAPPPRRRDGG
jgi:hypothetical protein